MCFLLEAPCLGFLGQALALRLSLGRRRSRLLSPALGLRRRLLLLGTPRGLLLALTLVTIDPGLPLFRGKLGLQSLSLELVVGLRAFDLTLGLTLLSLGVRSCCFGLGVDLSLLQPSLAGKLIVAEHRSRCF